MKTQSEPKRRRRHTECMSSWNEEASPSPVEEKQSCDTDSKSPKRRKRWKSLERWR
ncbi:TPA_asm: hypothetical protein HUJ06_000102 (mitochondrion) [Nelumbo nucifera]|uniref:Uncharacterized protein n=1 Tax=Nelumbo nucifera TaxID=4432 RepID=A0A823A7K0_NELNU|nr:TPA_asm: hypothetical protein HUJ06_027083 [Nelumbo nucifera]DAD49588.1 TPA_asm: hypothetical protein HUJ06_000102 [Nelumbo nucifera]